MESFVGSIPLAATGNFLRGLVEFVTRCYGPAVTNKQMTRPNPTDNQHPNPTTTHLQSIIMGRH